VKAESVTVNDSTSSTTKIIVGGSMIGTPSLLLIR